MSDLNSAPPPASRLSLSPEDWIEAATELLADKSVDAVKVDALARQLGVTRGSFYWHFRDRDDLLCRILDTWHRASTPRLVARFGNRSDPPEVLIREVLSLPQRGRSARRAARIELAIRAWARRDDMARKAVDAVDSERVEFITSCFVAAGFPPEIAAARAFLAYAYDVTQSLLHDHPQLAPQPERMALIEQVLLQPLPTEKPTPG